MRGRRRNGLSCSAADSVVTNVKRMMEEKYMKMKQCTLNKGDLLIAMPREAGWCNAAAVIEGHIAVGYVFCLYVKSR